MSTLRHERQLGRRDRLVLGADNRPGRDCRPGGRSGRCRERVQSKGALDGSEDCRFRRRYIVGKAGVEAGVVGPGRDLQVEVVVARWLGGINDEIEDVVEVTPAGKAGARLGEAQLFQGLALGRLKGVHVNEGLHVRVPIGRIGDDRAPVRMAHEHDGPRDRAEVTGQISRIARKPAQRVRRRINGISLVLEDGDYVVPARSVGPRTVHEHNGGLGPTGPACDGPWGPACALAEVGTTRRAAITRAVMAVASAIRGQRTARLTILLSATVLNVMVQPFF